MRPQPKKARDELVKALEALQDPIGYCRQRGHAPGHEYAYVAGAVQHRIEIALHALGEPINPHRPHGVPYHRAGSAPQL